MFDITEDAVGPGAKEGDLADLVAEEDAEEGVAEFMDHRPRCRQPDMDLLAHEHGGAEANRRRQEVHGRGDEEDGAEKDQQLLAADEEGLTAVKER